MGTWGLAAFENDDAVDLRYEIEEGGWTVATRAMAKVILKFGYLEAPDSQRGVAAATLVAAKRRPDVVDLSPEVAILRDLLPPPPPFSAQLARLTLNRVMRRSELQELWAESPELDEWRAETSKSLQAL